MCLFAVRIDYVCVCAHCAITVEFVIFVLGHVDTLFLFCIILGVQKIDTEFK